MVEIYLQDRDGCRACHPDEKHGEAANTRHDRLHYPGEDPAGFVLDEGIKQQFIRYHFSKLALFTIAMITCRIPCIRRIDTIRVANPPINTENFDKLIKSEILHPCKAAYFLSHSGPPLLSVCLLPPQAHPWLIHLLQVFVDLFGLLI